MNNHPEIESINKPAKYLVVLMHGIGSDGNDLINIVPFISNHIKDAHFFSPHGIEPYDNACYGRQWFSLKNRSASQLKKLASISAPKIYDIVHSKQKELSISNDKTILIGFSQGAMMASYLSLISHKQYLATIMFSGMLLPPELINNYKTPICIIHGKLDSVINYKEAIISKQFLQTKLIPSEIHCIDNLEHTIDSRGIDSMISFLKPLLQ